MNLLWKYLLPCVRPYNAGFVSCLPGHVSWLQNIVTEPIPNYRWFPEHSLQDSYNVL